MKKLTIALLSFIILISFISCDKVANNISDDYSNVSKKSSNTTTETEKIILNTVSFNTNGGTAIKSQKTDLLKNAPHTTRENYLFEGWFLDETLTQAVTFPLTVKSDITIYAKWLKIKDTQKINNCSIKMWNGNSSSLSAYVTPTGFDFDVLNAKNYKIKITISYDVYYQKDYDAPLDIGYAGSPKYEISITNSEGTGKFQNDLSTSKSGQTRTITYETNAINYKNDKIKLNLSTDNIQNTIFFENIVVTYECIK